MKVFLEVDADLEPMQGGQRVDLTPSVQPARPGGPHG